MGLRNQSPLVLPNELLELIINNLQADNDDDQESLISCSYANRILCIICQTRLFQNVVVIHGEGHGADNITLFDDKQSTGNRFLRLLDGSPHIGSYVRKITLKAVFPRSLSDADTIASRDPQFSFYAIPSRLQNLQEFILLAPTYFRWRNFDEPTKTFLRNMTQRLPVLDFHLIEGIPISVFYNCAALRGLRIASFERNTDPTAMLHTRAKLRALEVGYDSESHISAPKELPSWFKPTSSPFDLRHLMDLTLPSNDYFMSDIQGMLELCSNTLERLDFHLGYQYELPFEVNGLTPGSEPEITPPNLGSLHQLRRLTFRTAICGSGELLTSDIPFASSILKTLSYDMHHPPLELILDIYLQGYPIDCLSTFPWFILVNVLCGNQILPRLAGVELKFLLQVGCGGVEISPQDLASSLDQNEDLSKLRGKGLLSYTYS
ncbi:hypothetical protein GALMADRAFT_134681 [Galerina marginata CBS 339.88]|uniref:F-box domain-containing protein n=1 Tax=Galerina marginata (strain CBS 339.88) TaxID=685588 RepID=A0A067TJ46_GALM3|nr:hypothetical protein GALMADRAFT_134681 [Galerina marginata CBS 339.88]